MSLVFVIEAVEQIRHTLNSVAAALCHDEDVKISQSEQKKSEILLEFKALDEKLIRLIEGEKVPNITGKESEKPQEEMPDAA